MMSDSKAGEKKAGVPSWQLKPKEETTKEEEKPAPESPSRETIIEQAKKFLEEDEVRNSSTSKKVAFLESKGLRSEEIQDLLGITKSPEASSEVSPRLPSKIRLINISRLHEPNPLNYHLLLHNNNKSLHNHQ